MNSERDTQPTSDMPDQYDRQMGMLHDLPDVVKTKLSTIRDVGKLGVGGSRVFIVQSVRQRERGDTIFLEVSDNQGTVRLVIPPKVAAVIARQRESLTTMTRKKIGRERAANDAALGVVPGFMRKAAK